METITQLFQCMGMTALLAVFAIYTLVLFKPKYGRYVFGGRLDLDSMKRMVLGSMVFLALSLMLLANKTMSTDFTVTEMILNMVFSIIFFVSSLFNFFSKTYIEKVFGSSLGLMISAAFIV